MDRKTISKLLGISEKSFYRWKEERLIFSLLEKYFSDSELKEFLKTGKIQKFDSLNLFFEKREFLRKKYLEYFTTSSIHTIANWDEQGHFPFWFGMLWYLRKNGERHNNFQGAAISFCLSPMNLIKNQDDYPSSSVAARGIPFLQYLDGFDGMYGYIVSIVNNIEDLRQVEGEELEKEAEIHINRFLKYGEELEEQEQRIFEEEFGKE